MAANLPLILNGIVYQSDGSTVITSCRVTARNETTNETLTADTNSSGQYVMDCANFTSGYTLGDNVSLLVLYTNYEKSTTVTLVEGVITTNLTVTAVPASDDLRYFTVQDFFDYTDFSSDSSDIPSSTDIVKIGVGVEAEIDRMCNTSFDSNDYAVTDEYHDVKNEFQDTYFLKKKPVVAITEFQVNHSSEGEVESWSNLIQNQMDACDATTDWSATTDGAVTLNTTAGETSGPKEGSGCLNISKTAGTQSTVTFSKTFGSTYDFTSRALGIWFYNTALTDLKASGSTGLEIRFGSSASAYYYWQENSEDLGTGWSSRTYNLSTVTGTTGTPDRTACDYFAIKLTYSASATTVAAPRMRLDDITIGPSEAIDIDYNTGRVKILNSTNFADPGIQQIKSTYTYGLSSVPNDVRKLAILMTARDMMQMKVARAGIAGRDEFAPGSLTALDKQIESILSNRRYNTMYII